MVDKELDKESVEKDKLEYKVGKGKADALSLSRAHIGMLQSGLPSGYSLPFPSIEQPISWH